MNASAKPQSRAVPVRKSKRTYRGVKLLTPAARPRFSIAQIKKAVEDAVAKNADALAGSK